MDKGEPDRLGNIPAAGEDVPSPAPDPGSPPDGPSTTRHRPRTCPVTQHTAVWRVVLATRRHVGNASPASRSSMVMDRSADDGRLAVLMPSTTPPTDRDERRSGAGSYRLVSRSP